MAALSRPGGLLVRDAIWMRRTERIAQVLELDKVFGKLLELPAEVEASLTEVLGADWLIGSYHALVLHPEPAPMNASERDDVLADHLHNDYPYGHATGFHGGSARARASQWPHTMQLLWMLSDFTEENGATLVLPSSHTDGGIPQRHRGADFARFRAGALPVTGRAGDLLVYYGQLWHSVGLNHAAAPRAALIGQALPFYMAPMEAHARTLPMRVQRSLTPRAARALGLNWHHFFSSLVRLAPLPRGPVGGARFLLDALWEGYPPPHHPEAIRQTLALIELRPAVTRLALALMPVWTQPHRWLVIGARRRSTDPLARSSRARPSSPYLPTSPHHISLEPSAPILPTSPRISPYLRIAERGRPPPYYPLTTPLLPPERGHPPPLPPASTHVLRAALCSRRAPSWTRGCDERLRRCSAWLCSLALPTQCRPISPPFDKSGAVFGGPAAVLAYTRRRCRSSRSPPPAWLVCLASLAAGLILGGNLALERVRM